MRPQLPMLLLLWPAWAGAAETLSLSIGRIDGPGWSAREVQAELHADGRLSARVARAEGPPLPTALRGIDLRCRVGRGSEGIACRDGHLKATAPKLGALSGRFVAEVRDAAHWRLQLDQVTGELSGQDASERYVAEKLAFTLASSVLQAPGRLSGQTRLQLRSGQGYADPVFADFSAHPLTVQADWTLARRLLQLEAIQLQQPGIGVLRGTASLPLAAPAAGLVADVTIDSLTLAPVAELYAKPFLVGSRMADIAADGQARGQLTIRKGAVAALALDFDGAALQLGKLGLAVEGLNGQLQWSADAAQAGESALQWSRLSYGKLETHPAAMRFSAGARDFRLAAPLRLGILDGALNIHQLQLQQAGQPGMSAAFEADIEPIELAGLCRAFGWPEFSGTLAGRLPGLTLANDVMSLDGELSARAFDGDIRIGALRVIQPFSVLPRVAADIRLRNLDLKLLTSAFSFGRIEGRLHGDVTGLRLLGWRPVAMDAHLYTPPGDRSRHRISQRAIDSISRAGGGPAGILKRSALRVFDDFAYDKIGWSCQLDNGVCIMDGVEPAKNGGYVLVKGRLLPRIDVVGYSRRVGWETFLGQLKAAMDSEGAEVR